jgi:hypothetical protein
MAPLVTENGALIAPEVEANVRVVEAAGAETVTFAEEETTLLPES